VALRCLTVLFEFDLGGFRNEELKEKMKIAGFAAMNSHCYRNTSDPEMINATFKVCFCGLKKFVFYH